jgi:hypothetical protein
VVPATSNDHSQVDRQQPEASMASEADSDAMDIDEPEANAPIITTFSKPAEKEQTPILAPLKTIAPEVADPDGMVESSYSDNESSSDSSSSDSDSGSESDDEQGSGSEEDNGEQDSSSEEGDVGETASDEDDGDNVEEDDDMDMGEFNKSDSPVPMRISNATAEDTVADAQEDLVAPVRSLVSEQSKEEVRNAIPPYPCN